MISVLFFDSEMPQRVPGFSRKSSSALFPFFGDYHLLDFALANIYPLQTRDITFFSKTAFSRSLSSLINSWRITELELKDIELSALDFLDFLKKLDSTYILLYNLTFVSVLDSIRLQEILAALPSQIVKIASSGVPLDLYLINKKTLISLIMDFKQQLSSDKLFFDTLFSEILHNSFDTIEELDGELFFINNLVQLYENHIHLIQGRLKAKVFDKVGMFPANRLNESHITASGQVKNSFLSSAVRVDGHVENSILFPGVSVKEGAVIRNSVIMNNNQIGRNTIISNCLIFPHLNEGGSIQSIGDHCMIGEKATPSTKRIINTNFPRQITEGLTVIGMNPNIPREAVIEAGCYIGPDLSAVFLKKAKKIKRGNSIYA